MTMRKKSPSKSHISDLLYETEGARVSLSFIQFPKTRPDSFRSLFSESGPSINDISVSPNSLKPLDLASEESRLGSGWFFFRVNRPVMDDVGGGDGRDGWCWRWWKRRKTHHGKINIKREEKGSEWDEVREEGRRKKKDRGSLVILHISGFIKGKIGSSGVKSWVSEVLTQSVDAM